MNESGALHWNRKMCHESDKTSDLGELREDY